MEKRYSRSGVRRIRWKEFGATSSARHESLRADRVDTRFELARALTYARERASADPIIILAAPRSYSSVVAAMLGQHPQLYGLPEMELFSAGTMTEWWRLCELRQGANAWASHANYPRAHGAIRAVAELFFGGQTEETVRLAIGWLWRRSHFTTGLLLEELAKRIQPRILVEKSTSNVYRIGYMQRADQMFPEARFIHLIRHPRGQGESVVRFIEARETTRGPLSRSNWVYQLGSDRGRERNGEKETALDPQRSWLTLNRNICAFLKNMPADRKMEVRGEDLLRKPATVLKQIVGWLGLRTDRKAILAMKHPERSPFARFGPQGARFGGDGSFLRDPRLRPLRAKSHSLDGPLSWRSDGLGFSSEVSRMAKEFGYT